MNRLTGNTYTDGRFMKINGMLDGETGRGRQMYRCRQMMDAGRQQNKEKGRQADNDR